MMLALDIVVEYHRDVDQGQHTSQEHRLHRLHVNQHMTSW